MDRKVALRLKMHNIKNENIYPALILYEVMKGSKLVQGYVKLDENIYAWHLWVEYNNKILDVNRELYLLWAPGTVEKAWEYSKDYTGKLLDGYEDSENVYELYKSGKDIFWRNTPSKIKTVRQKIINSIKV